MKRYAITILSRRVGGAVVDLPASSGQFRAAFGGIDIELTLDGSRALIDEVRERRLDLAFTQPPDTSLDGIGTHMFAC